MKNIKEYNTLYMLLKRGLNNKAKNDLVKYKSNPINRIIKEIEYKIIDRGYRKDRREVMVKIMKYFYTTLYKSKTNQISPSMRTIAMDIFKLNSRTRDKDIHAATMRVQRAIKSLEEMRLIKIHKYYIDDLHFKSHKAPCFFYELISIYEEDNNNRIILFNKKIPKTKTVSEIMEKINCRRSLNNVSQTRKRIILK